MKFTSDAARDAGKKSSRAGIGNQVTTEIRERFKDLIEANIDKLQKDIVVLEPLQRLKVILDLAKFVVPTLKSVEQSSQKVGMDPLIINIVRDADK